MSLRLAFGAALLAASRPVATQPTAAPSDPDGRVIESWVRVEDVYNANYPECADSPGGRTYISNRNTRASSCSPTPCEVDTVPRTGFARCPTSVCYRTVSCTPNYAPTPTPTTGSPTGTPTTPAPHLPTPMPTPSPSSSPTSPTAAPTNDPRGPPNYYTEIINAYETDSDDAQYVQDAAASCRAGSSGSSSRQVRSCAPMDCTQWPTGFLNTCGGRCYRRVQCIPAWNPTPPPTQRRTQWPTPADSPPPPPNRPAQEYVGYERQTFYYASTDGNQAAAPRCAGGQYHASNVTENMVTCFSRPCEETGGTAEFPCPAPPCYAVSRCTPVYPTSHQTPPPPTLSPPPSTDTSANSSSDSSDDSGLSGGAIAGIVIGVLAAVVVVGLLVAFRSKLPLTSCFSCPNRKSNPWSKSDGVIGMTDNPSFKGTQA